LTAASRRLALRAAVLAGFISWTTLYD